MRPGDHFTLGEARREPALRHSDVILLRQDPPFDLAYITSTHFLERIHPKTAGGQQSPPAVRKRAGKRSSWPHRGALMVLPAMAEEHRPETALTRASLTHEEHLTQLGLRPLCRSDSISISAS